jgi:hypothetical protein
MSRDAKNSSKAGRLSAIQEEELPEAIDCIHEKLNDPAA